MAKLIIESGEGRGRKYQIGGSVFIGRSKKNQIPIDDQQISRRHTKVLCKDGAFFLQDLGSKNGTLLNGNAIKDVVPLKPGDRIRIGGNIILFAANDYKAPPAAPKIAQPAAAAQPEPEDDEILVPDRGEEAEAPDADEGEEMTVMQRPRTLRAASAPKTGVPAFVSFLYYAALFFTAVLAARSVFIPMLQIR